MSEPIEPELKMVVEHLPYYVAVVDADARFVWTNRIDATLRREDVIGKPFDSFTPAEGQATSRAVVERCLRTGASGYYEVCAYADGGYEQWYGCRVVRLPADSSGRPRALILSSDVNERRKAQEALARSEARFRCLVEATPDYISIIDDQRRVLYLNHEPPGVSGLRREDVVGVPLDAFVEPSSLPDAIAAIEEAFATGRPTSYESRDAVGMHHFHIDVVPLAEPSDPSARAMLVSRDVTRAREEARARENMVAELDHRVKNTLAVVLAMAEQTLARADSLAGFRDAFTGRLRSLTRTHEALAHARWGEVLLSEVMARTLGAVGGAHLALRPGSPDPLLPPNVVTPLSLALHEHTTNALKHGALSTRPADAARSLEVWSTLEEGPTLTLHWREAAPQPAHTPQTGLGLRLVHGLIVRELGGTFETTVGPDERRHRLSVRLAPRG